MSHKLLRSLVSFSIIGILLLMINLNFSIAGGRTDVLLLSCIDFRLPDKTHTYMNERGFKEKYDHVILAGASLGAVTDQFPAWNQTFWEHLEIAIQLHHIKKVMIMDHRDCGAYRVIFDEDFYKDKKSENEIHIKTLTELRSLINEKYPELEVELLIMDLDGKVEVIE